MLTTGPLVPRWSILITNFGAKFVEVCGKVRIMNHPFGGKVPSHVVQGVPCLPVFTSLARRAWSVIRWQQPNPLMPEHCHGKCEPAHPLITFQPFEANCGRSSAQVRGMFSSYRSLGKVWGPSLEVCPKVWEVGQISGKSLGKVCFKKSCHGPICFPHLASSSKFGSTFGQWLPSACAQSPPPQQTDM